MAAGAPSMGIKAKNGVVLAVEKKQKSFLYDESSITKVGCNYKETALSVYVKRLVLVVAGKGLVFYCVVG